MSVWMVGCVAQDAKWTCGYRQWFTAKYHVSFFFHFTIMQYFVSVYRIRPQLQALKFALAISQILKSLRGIITSL